MHNGKVGPLGTTDRCAAASGGGGWRRCQGAKPARVLSATRSMDWMSPSADAGLVLHAAARWPYAALHPGGMLGQGALDAILVLHADAQTSSFVP